MSRLLFVEDEDRLARSVVLGLSEEGFVVDREADGESGLWRAQTMDYAVMVLDIRLPKLSGIQLCRRIRATGAAVPILMLTACDTTEDVVEGLNAGADDYLTKPFAFEELLARIRALLRRSSRSASPQLACGDLVLDPVERTATRAGREIPLSPMEFAVLEHLLLHVGAPQTKARLAAAIWKDEVGPPSNALEVCISSLRKKLSLPGQVDLIRTRRGVGYLIAPEHEQDPR
ncbi:MAG TPA: response regulator transcription factor [Planctomycetota bacterium]|nr:response regulator transcription factor [Planctomycetota bacterium]HPF12622.1 response regulator transcription factor [Planctomycetota bacterium]HRV79790.1 response regulator transcription factor [Planctomycetota bacterium]